MNPPSGCRFHTRCPFVIDRCREEMPALAPWSDGHLTACHRAAELPAAGEATASHVAPVAAQRLALYAQRRAESVPPPPPDRRCRPGAGSPLCVHGLLFA